MGSEISGLGSYLSVWSWWIKYCWFVEQVQNAFKNWNSNFWLYHWVNMVKLKIHFFH